MKPRVKIRRAWRKMFLEKMVNLKKRRVEIEYLQKKLGQNVIATHGLRYAICILGKKTKKLSSNI